MHLVAFESEMHCSTFNYSLLKEGATAVLKGRPDISRSEPNQKVISKYWGKRGVEVSMGNRKKNPS
jgi:hypothetical protein